MNYITNIKKGGIRRFFGSSGKKPIQKNQSKLIIAKIVSEFKDKNRKDIDKWRTALQAAENPETPRRAILHDLYDDLSTDGHLQSQIQIRKMATLSNKFAVIDKKTGKENIEKTNLLKTKWFHLLVSYILDSVYKGFTLIELTNTATYEFTKIPYRNVIPEQDTVLFEAYGDEGILYNSPLFDNFLIKVGDKKNIGILNNIIPQLIWKRNAQQSWAEYAEKFGIPMITATTTKADKKEIDRIEAMLTQLGEAAQAVLPEGTTIDIKETADKGNYEIYDKQIERTNSEISKQILGGTMVSDNGSSRSQSEVHERTLDAKITEADRIEVEFTVNNQVFPILTIWGLPFNENDLFVYDRTQAVNISKHWDIVNQALEKFNIPIEWVSKTFNIPIESVKENNAPGGVTANFTMPLDTGADNSLRFPKYPISLFEAATNSKKVIDDLNTESEEILKQLWNKKDATTFLVAKSIIAGTWLRNGLFEGWSNRRLEIDYDATDHVALAFMEYNLFHFSKARELGTIQKLNELLVDKDKFKIRSFSDFQKAAEPFLNNVNKNWLKTEYNHAIAVGQSASAYQQHWSEKDTITKYIQYQTVGDSNVRSEHAVLDGKIFNIEDSDARRLYAPNGWGCRCEMIQHIGKPKNITSGAKAIGLLKKNTKSPIDGFMINRGEVKRVFEANQMYIKYKTSQFDTDINKLKFDTYGLKKHKSMKNLKTLKFDNSITKKNVSELFKTEKDKNYMGFSDYLKRKMKLNRSTFDFHTKGKYIQETENRHKMFPYIKGVINKPDEVYLRKEKNTVQYRYIKFYKNIIFVVDTEVGKEFTIKTWYPSKIGDEIRKGLLIR